MPDYTLYLDQPTGTYTVNLDGGMPGPNAIIDTTAIGLTTTDNTPDYLIGYDVATGYARRVALSAVVPATYVQTFNTRSGAVILSSSDVTTALGFSDIARTGIANTFTASQYLAVSGHGFIQVGATLTARLRVGCSASPSGLQNYEFTSRDGQFQFSLLQDSWGSYVSQYLMVLDGTTGVAINKTSASAQLDVSNSLTTQPVVILRNKASQTANTQELWGVSSTSTNRAQAAINSAWQVSTDATRAGYLSLGAYYTTTFQEGLRITATSGGSATVENYAEVTAQPRGLIVSQHNSGIQAALTTWRKSRGTRAGQTATASGDLIGSLSFQGHDGSGYLTDNCLFGASVTAAVTSGSVPTSIWFSPGSAASTYTPSLLLYHDGKIGVGRGFNTILSALTAPSAQLHVKVQSAGDVGGIVQGFLSQTANLTEWQNNAGTVQLAIAANGRDFILDTTTGTKFGTATNQKLAFFNATPVVQQTMGAATAGASYTATEQAMLQKVYDVLRTFGFGT